MKRLACLGALIVALLAWKTAQADFYVINTPGRVGTAINTLPFTITSAGSYYLGNNLTTETDGIIVNADDVTIDLMGFCITGPGKVTSVNYHGVEVSAARTNVEVRNGTIKSFGGGGIEAPATSSNIRALGVRVSNTNYGIRLHGKNHQVLNCSVIGNNTGIHVETGSLIKGNQVYNNSESGISVDWSNLIVGNVIEGNGRGINISSGSSVIDNVLHLNGDYGIYGFSYNRIIGNNIIGSSEDGIHVIDHCIIMNNAVDDLVYGVNCTVLNNNVY